MKNVLGACALIVTIYALPMCQTYQQKLFAADQALTQNAPETAKTDWIIATLTTMQATLMNCLNVYGIPAMPLDNLSKLTPKDPEFKQAFQLALINYSIHLAILESHPLVKLFCSSMTASCIYPSVLPLEHNYFTKSYFHNLVKRIMRLLPHAADLQKADVHRKAQTTASIETPCSKTCDLLKNRLLFISEMSLIGQLQTLDMLLNSCIDFYQCAPNGCPEQAVLASKTSLTAQELNTELTNLEIRLALLEAQPKINLFCPTSATCDTVGLVSSLDAQQRIHNLTQRLLRIWPMARAQFPATCVPQEQPDLERHETEQQEQESGGGDGDDTDEEKNDKNKRESEIHSILQ